MQLYGLWSHHDGNFFSFNGRTLVHNNRAELEFLFPRASVRPIPTGISPEESMPFSQHPQLAGVVEWPLRKEQFR